MFGHDPTRRSYEEPDTHISWEGHFYDVDSGALSARPVPGSQMRGARGSFSLEMPKGWTGGEVAFAIDHLHPSVDALD